MEAFSGILGALGKMGGSVLGGLEKNPLGSLTSVLGSINQFSLAQKEKAAMDRATYYSKHPEAIANMVTGLTKPLSTGLVKGTENIVNASLAEQGLSQAPGIQTQVLSQALAPYQQQEQQFALQEAFKAIGLPIEALSAIQSTMRPDQLAMMLKGILPGGGGGTGGGGGFQLPNTDPSGGGWGVPPSDIGITAPDVSGGGNQVG
jgi:hypothetical protein